MAMSTKEIVEELQTFHSLLYCINNCKDKNAVYTFLYDLILEVSFEDASAKNVSQTIMKMAEKFT